MLFQGQEFGGLGAVRLLRGSRPELAAAVQKGRAEFLSQFPSLASAEIQSRLPVPHDPAMFDRCKLNWDERDTQKAHVKLHRDLLALRRRDAAFRAQDADAVDGAVLAPELFVLRFLAAGAAEMSGC